MRKDHHLRNQRGCGWRGLAVALMADISLMAEEAGLPMGTRALGRRRRSRQYHLAAALRACESQVLLDHGRFH